jgi:hypothetical protein
MFGGFLASDYVLSVMTVLLIIIEFSSLVIPTCEGPLDKNCLNSQTFFKLCILYRTASVVLWSEFLATDPEVLGSIPGATRFSEK